MHRDGGKSRLLRGAGGASLRQGRAAPARCLLLHFPKSAVKCSKHWSKNEDHLVGNLAGCSFWFALQHVGVETLLSGCALCASLGRGTGVRQHGAGSVAAGGFGGSSPLSN